MLWTYGLYGINRVLTAISRLYYYIIIIIITFIYLHDSETDNLLRLNLYHLPLNIISFQTDKPHIGTVT